MSKNAMQETKYALEIDKLAVEYRTANGTVKALNGLDLKIEKGKTLGLVGETGAGKTTTGLAILRLIQEPPGVIVDGSIVLNGENLLKKTENEMGKIRGKQVSMIFQDPMTSLNPVMKVEDQIAEVIELQESLSWDQALLKAREMLELVGISKERGNEYPHQFSGGMKQRVVIAIALACSPQLLIADEPSTALDVTIQAQVLQLMKNLRQKYDMSMLMITHDLGIVVEICDTVRASSDRYRQGQDHIAAFIAEMVGRKEGKKIAKRELTEQFKIWFQDQQGGRRAPKGIELHEFMDKKFGKAKRDGWHNVEIIYPDNEIVDELV